MADIKIFNPVELSKPRSPYMQVARVKTSEFAFIAGQVSVDASGTLIGHDDFKRNARRSSPIFTQRCVRSERTGRTS